MNHAGVQVDVRRAPLGSRLRAPPYNLSLSSFLSIIPGSQLLHRLRKGNSWLFEPSVTLNLSELDLEVRSSSSVAEAAWPTAGEASSTLAAETAGENVREYQQISSFPSPWEFFTSGYIAGLLIMTILLHRMQNVVIPSARRARYGYRTPSQRTTLWGRLQAALLPLDFSRTGTRFIFHLPTVYCLSNVLIIWIILVLQTCEVQLGDQKGTHVGRLEKLARSAMDKDMAQICWTTFCAVCGAFLMEGLIKALDRLGGSGGGFPIGGVNSVSPFHLVSYAFLLHIYSSPHAHGFHPPDDSPSRPDKHVVITITIALLQLSMFHILSISKRLSTHRLIPTALTSMLSLAHFHATLFSHITKAPNNASVAATPDLPAQRNDGYIAAGATYPLLNYVPNLFETALFATILLTVTVNAIAQLLIRGRIDHVFSGLGIFNGLPNDDGTHNGFFASLPYEEDFIIVLLRLGVASMEATGLRGWNNEVAPIQRPRIGPRKVWAPRSRSDLGHSMEDTYGRVRMGRLGVGQVQYGSTSVGLRKGDYEVKNRAAQWRRPQLYVPRLRRGFNNDVRIIDLGHASGSGLFSGPWKRSIVAFWQFLVVFCGVVRGLVSFLLDRARRRVDDPRRERKERQAVSEEREAEEGDAESTNEEDTDTEVYQRFLRGEDISDDGDGEDEDEAAIERSWTPSDGETSDETDEEKHFQEREGEVVDLFTDLLRNPDVRTVSGPEQINGHSGSSGEMALAHLLHGSAVSPRPLTRHLWKTLTQRDNPSLGDQQVMSDRYYRDAEQRDKEKGFQHICVICMLESREIICWPCRCLAMCDGCRETLALRTPGSKHRCPCCRQIVDGYSKIYIP